MVQRGSEILPEREPSTRIIGREQQGEHVHKAEAARGSHQNSEYQRYPNRQLSVSYEERDRRGVWQDDPL